VCDLETSRMGAPYIYDISHLRVNDVPDKSLRILTSLYALSACLRESEMLEIIGF